MNELTVSNIPESWDYTRLDDVVERCRGREDPQDYPDLPYIGLKHIEENSMKLIGRAQANEYQSTSVHFYPEDVLYGRLRPYLNKVYVADFEGLGSGEIIVLTPTEEVYPPYIAYVINSQEFVRYADHQSTGDRPRVSYDKIRKFEFPLPPVNEQIGIVSKIEELLSKLDTGVEELKEADLRLDRYRKSVLEGAVEGKIEVEVSSGTQDIEERKDRLLSQKREVWEESELEKLRINGDVPENDDWKDKYKEPLELDDLELPDIPDSWFWTTLDAVSGYNVDYRGKTPPYSDSGIPVISAGNVKEGRIQTEDPKFVDQETYDEWLTRGKPHPGDVIVTTEAPVGETAIYPDDEKFLPTRRVIAFRPVGINSKFLQIAFESDTVVSYLNRHSRGTTVPRILKEQLRKTPIPVPPREIQEKIVKFVDQAESIVINTKEVVSDELRRSKRLRQSILKTAFEGKLVPHDTNHKPTGSTQTEDTEFKPGKQATLPGVTRDAE